MNKTDYQNYYEQLTDDQLRLVLADRQDLVPDAVAALDREVQRRKLGLAKRPQWKPLPETNQRAHCLEDYPKYRQLTARRRVTGRYAFPIAIGPLVLALVFARSAIENSLASIVLTVGWALVVSLYALSVSFRWLGFRCPQCGESFGRGDECFSCGFPRSCPRGRSPANTSDH